MSILRIAQQSLLVLAAVAINPDSVLAAAIFDFGIPAAWTCSVGICNDPTNTTVGTSATVTVPSVVIPLSSAYGWVSSFGGANGASPFANAQVPSSQVTPGLGNTNGSWLRTTPFVANAGDALDFQFNYVTSDGGTFADYSWVRLLNAGDLSQADVIFTARTTNVPNIDPIPGFGLPAFGQTTLTMGNNTVASVPLISAGYVPSALAPPNYLGVGPTWSPLGAAFDGTCWDIGCGYTGWVSASYSVAGTGNYVLEFGVTNWDDNAWDSGLAFNAITIAGTPIEDSSVPEPATVTLFAAALASLGVVRRRKYWADAGQLLLRAPSRL